MVEGFYVECHNPRCPRRNILVQRIDGGALFCRKCGSKMQSVESPNVKDHVQLQLGDGEWAMIPRHIMNKVDRSGSGNTQTQNNNLLGFKKPEPEHSDTFTCNPDIKGCPLIVKPEIYIHKAQWDELIYMAKQLDSEWIGYLKGEQDTSQLPKVVWNITSVYFPAQTAGAAHCVPDDRTVEEGTIGDIHSHVSMTAKFSSTDLNSFNHDVAIVINRDGNYDSRVRVKLGCGQFERAEATVYLIHDEQLKAKLDDLKSKIKTPVYASNFTAPDKPIRAKHNGVSYTSDGGDEQYDWRLPGGEFST